MMKKFTLLTGLIFGSFAFGQIDVYQDFEHPYNVWANPESGIDRFVTSSQYFCGGEGAAGHY